jgi:DNA-binding NarL/FixJ family response regulator
MKLEKIDRLLLAINRVLTGAIYVSDQVAAQAVKRLADGAPMHEPEENADTYVERLTDRELQVFRLIGRGLGTRLIAETLHLSRKTIESHREHIKAKLGLKNGSELIQRAIQWAQHFNGAKQ